MELTPKEDSPETLVATLSTDESHALQGAFQERYILLFAEEDEAEPTSVDDVVVASLTLGGKDTLEIKVIEVDLVIDTLSKFSGRTNEIVRQLSRNPGYPPHKNGLAGERLLLGMVAKTLVEEFTIEKFKNEMKKTLGEDATTEAKPPTTKKNPTLSPPNPTTPTPTPKQNPTP